MSARVCTTLVTLAAGAGASGLTRAHAPQEAFATAGPEPHLADFRMPTGAGGNAEASFLPGDAHVFIAHGTP